MPHSPTSVKVPHHVTLSPFSEKGEVKHTHHSVPSSLPASSTSLPLVTLRTHFQSRSAIGGKESGHVMNDEEANLTMPRHRGRRFNCSDITVLGGIGNLFLIGGILLVGVLFLFIEKLEEVPNR